jgi:nitronate monooxygenase
MFLVSGTELVIEACKAGIIGSFPSLNARPVDEYPRWLERIEAALEAHPGAAPYAVNLIVHRTNARLDDDLAVTVAHEVPVVITSIGHPGLVAEAVHAYGGVVLHDVIHLHHARKALEAGVDGLILVAAGAGGHAGTLSPFAIVRGLRAFFDGPLVLAGAISDGASLAAAVAMGADLAYLGTRFIATQESTGGPDYSRMIVASAAKDIIYTPAITGVNANFLRASIKRAGLDPDTLPPKPPLDMDKESEAKAWRDIWSAGQGVGTIDDIPSVAELVARLRREYDDALSQMAARHAARAHAQAAE